MMPAASRPKRALMASNFCSSAATAAAMRASSVSRRCLASSRVCTRFCTCVTGKDRDQTIRYMYAAAENKLAVCLNRSTLTAR